MVRSSLKSHLLFLDIVVKNNIVDKIIKMLSYHYLYCFSYIMLFFIKDIHVPLSTDCEYISFINVLFEAIFFSELTCNIPDTRLNIISENIITVQMFFRYIVLLSLGLCGLQISVMFNRFSSTPSPLTILFHEKSKLLVCSF